MLKGEKVKLKPRSSCFKSLISSFLDVHNHRYFRGTFCGLIFLHIITVMIPVTDLEVNIPNGLKEVFNYLFELWPLPTFQMSESNHLLIRNVMFKALEIIVMLLYTIDLLPKIFYWRKPLYWKLLNIFVVTIMVLQVPLTMIGYLESKHSIENLKVRICSISLSFILMCEIMSIRERRNLKLYQQNLQKIKDPKKTEEEISDEMIKTRLEGEITHEAIIASCGKKESGAAKEYSWIEIVKHDRPGDCWVVIHGKVYDLSAFAKVHPGGPMIYDGCGGDCTSMWESYHSLSMVKRGPPQEFVIGNVRDYEDFYSWDGSFFTTLKERVEKAIPKNKRQNDARLIVKGAIFTLAHLFSIYYFVKEFTFFSAMLYSVTAAQMNINVMHDGNHMAFSSNKIISQIAGYMLDLTFSTSVVYRRSHNFGHHGCVNHYELDRAFDTTFPIFRLHKLQPKLGFHKYQHIYCWLLYGMVNFGDLFGTFDELFWMSNYPTRRGFLTKKSYYGHILTKVIWFLLICVSPIYRFGFYEMFPVWVAYMVSFSYCYVFFFAVNHWTTEAQQVDNTSINKTNWGILQVENSSNFALDSTFWTHVSGGLNYQIEHHLFPNFAHTRLPEISQIVQDLCKEYGLKYFSFKTFWHALYSHYSLLKELAEAD